MTAMARGGIEDDRTIGRSLPITAGQLGGMRFRYIKLGPNGRWTARAIEEQALFLGHREVPHDVAMSGDRQRIAAFLQAMGRSAGKASDFTREIIDFHTLGTDTIWITFHDGRLYWTIADREVVWVGEDEERGARNWRPVFCAIAELRSLAS